MAAIDLHGFVADLKDHAIDHGFHVHDERHFVETYSLRQLWEIDLHPEAACGGPLDLHVALEVDPRVMLGFEEAIMMLEDPFEEPPDVWKLDLFFNWQVPPLPEMPDLLVLATDLAALGTEALPVEVSATSTFASVTDAPQQGLMVVGRGAVSLAGVFVAREQLCEELDASLKVSQYLVQKANDWGLSDS